jgi:hypothetical protein
MSLEVARERVVQALCSHYAQDRLTTQELESRLARAQRAENDAQLAALVVDLPALPDVPVPFPTAPPVPVTAPSRGSPAVSLAPTNTFVPTVRDDVPRQEKQNLVAVMFGMSRTGVWVPPYEIDFFALMGGAELDFREAILPSGVVEVNAIVVMGGLEIVIPPGVRVEVNGSGVMGGFAEEGLSDQPFAPDAPVIRINGIAIMGGVDVNVRYPGETSREAKRRRKQARKALTRGA